MMQELWHGDCLELIKDVADESVDLIILDPPYFRILNEKWDKFKNRNSYKVWTENYIKKLSTKLRLNGAILLFGCSRNINIVSDISICLESNGLEYIQEIIIDKGMKSIAGRISKKIKMLPPVSENIFVYRKNAKPFVKNLLKQKQMLLGYSSKEISEKMGFKTNGGGNWTKYCGDTEFPLFPAKEHWEKMMEIFSIPIDYKSIKETYNGIFGLTNVWDDIAFRSTTKHPSEKPLPLIERCVHIFSDEGDLVLDIFAGSGTTLVAAKNLNRQFIGIEKEKEYYDICLERLKEKEEFE